MKRFSHPDSEKRLTVLRDFARRIGATPNQVVLAWMPKTGLPVIPLFSASSEDQIKENLGYEGVELGESDLGYLNSLRFSRRKNE